MIPRAGEIARMRTTQEDHMPDTCVVLSYSATSDNYGHDVETYTPGSAIVCGYMPSSENEINEDSQTEVASAQMRLPISTQIGKLDRVQLTALKGETLAAPLLFQVTGTPKQGPSGLVVMLKRIEA